MKTILILLLSVTWLALSLPRTFAADGTPVWTNIYSGPGNNTDQAYSLALDANGNVFVTGYSKNASIPISSYDYLTIKYSNTGVPIWTNRYNGTGNGDDYAYCLALDTNGNVFVTGYSKGTGSGNDYVTIKYSNTGVSMWTNRYNGPGNGDDQAGQIVLDISGNVYVTGESTGSGSGYDFATIKYSNNGLPLWTNRFNGQAGGTDQAFSMVVDRNGNIYVAGNSFGSGGNYDYATVKYSTDGIPLWTNFYNGPGNLDDIAYSVKVDGGGNALVTGFTTLSGGTTDFATIKYSSDGMPLWTNRYNDPINNFDYATCLAVDGAGNVYVSGRCAVNLSGFNYAYATIKYSGAGVPLWTNKFSGAGNNYNGANSIVVDGSSNVFVTGESTGSGSGYDCTTIKYSTAGVPTWTNTYNGSANSSDDGVSLAVDSGGNVYVTGFATSSGSGSDYAIIKYSGPPPFIFLTTPGNFGFTNNQFILDLTGPIASNVVISASPDLQTWSPLVTNTLTGGTLIFTDTLATNFPSRFYRAMLQ
jgi:uncharacterized delta-60 repeat protein